MVELCLLFRYRLVLDSSRGSIVPLFWKFWHFCKYEQVRITDDRSIKESRPIVHLLTAQPSKQEPYFSTNDVAMDVQVSKRREKKKKKGGKKNKRREDDYLCCSRTNFVKCQKNEY